MSKKKQKTTNDQTSSNTSNSTATTTPNVPDWLLSPAQKQAGQIGAIIGQGPAAYSPVTSAAQQSVWDKAGGLSSSPAFQKASEALSGPISIGDISAGSVLNNLEKYYNPYKDQVLNPVLADYDVQSGKTRAAQAAQGAQGAFRGSRYGVREAETEGELARGRASTEGGLLGNMYTEATGLSAGDQNRSLSAAQANQQAQIAAANANLQRASLLAGLGTSQGADARANLSLQGDLGAQETAALNAARQYPISFAGQTGSLLSGLNPDAYSGRSVSQTGTEAGTSHGTQTTVSNPGLLGSLGQAAQIASLFMKPSDARLKTDVEPLGRDAQGHRWYRYRYLWDEPGTQRTGVMAQEVMAITPEAVMRHPAGFYMVDYGAL